MTIGMQIVLLALGLALYAYATRRRWLPRLQALRGAALAEGVRTYAGRLLAAPGAPEPAEGGALVVGGKVAAPAWLNLLNHQPDRYPHTLIIGPTGAGKTTFTMALLATRPGRVAVLTPTPDPADWLSVPIVTIDDSGEFAALTAAFVALGAELRGRLVAAKRAAPVGEPLTIVCDDWPVLASECGRPATDLFKLVGRLGRSLRVRLVVLSQSERVKSLGLEGEGDAVTNFARVDLARGHTATLAIDGLALPLDTRPVPQLASRPSDPARWWFPAEPVPAGEDRPDLAVPWEPVPGGSGAVPGDTGAPEPDADKIRTLARQGWSRNQIAGEIGGRRAEALRRIGAVLDGLGG